jgi:hypothetical protein
MSLITRRSCHIIGVNDEKLNRFVDEIKRFLVETGIPDTYSINVYKDQVTCCGHFPIGVAFEIEGPKMQPIKDIDEKILRKIKEICEREHVEYHECSNADVLLDVDGKVFGQGQY